MNRPRRGKALPLLLVLLLVVAGIGAYIYVPEWLKQRKIGDLGSRQEVRSTLVRAARRYEEKNKAWPQSGTALKDDAEVQKLPGGSLDRAKFSLAKSDKDKAEYTFEWEGKKYTVPVRSKRLDTPRPAAGTPQ